MALRGLDAARCAARVARVSHARLLSAAAGPSAAERAGDAAVSLAASWLARAAAAARPEDVAAAARLGALAGHPESAAFAMRYVDRVARPRDNAVAARQLAAVVDRATNPPAFLNALDRVLLRLAATFAPLLPGVVVPLARRRMRALVGGLVVPAEPAKLAKHVERVGKEGYAQNVNLLGEMVLGDDEAARRLNDALHLLKHEKVDYVSVKVSGITAQLNPWDFEGSLARVEENLVSLFRAAKEASPKTFVNIDMEAYAELELSVEAFTRVLSRDEFSGLDAGIVVQAYLPDALPTLQRLVEWSNSRCEKGGGQIKIRLVKGANLAMERVEAAMREWQQAPYLTKAETDANFLRCIDWMLGGPERLRSVRLGVGSHNLFTMAYARLLSLEKGLQDRVGFEMLQGMAPAHASVIREDSENGLLLYTPIVAEEDFDVAIAYLFRRLEENSSGENFMRSLFSMEPGSLEFEKEAARFKRALSDKDKTDLHTGPRRVQQRPASSAAGLHMVKDEAEALYDTKVRMFWNEPDTDPALPANRAWASAIIDPSLFVPSSSAILSSAAEVDAVLDRAGESYKEWQTITPEGRRDILYAIGDELARRRGDLVNAMVHEGSKVFAEADSEVSEAIDFARFYGDRALELPRGFFPFGTICVVSPWNYPTAIACGGIMSSLAAGNCVILKPAPETPRCAEILAECAWAAGVPRHVLQFARVPENELGKRLVCAADAVILTGSYDTACLFRSWKPDIRLFAETSGKNSMIITPAADIDLAVYDLAASAFGHTGQKCSAASLGIIVGELAKDARFVDQLKDATESLAVGSASSLRSTMGPLISAPNERLLHALERLDSGESWLVKPRCLDASEGRRIWTPGVKLGVENDSWFQQTECFGPVLGIIRASSLDEAVGIQNNSRFGLTAGLHSLDPSEIEFWKENVEAGNLYINRGTTGAIVCRQPFGGWKDSSCGPGAMAGGLNYVRQLGTVIENSSEMKEEDDGSKWLAAAVASDEKVWKDHFSQERDHSGLFCELNTHRYCPLPSIAVRIGRNAQQRHVERVESALKTCGISDVVWSRADEESDSEFAAHIAREADLGLCRVRVIGDIGDEVLRVAAAKNVHLACNPVVQDGRTELLNYVLEQSISRTIHRFGNLAAED